MNKDSNLKNNNSIISASNDSKEKYLIYKIKYSDQLGGIVCKATEKISSNSIKAFVFGRKCIDLSPLELKTKFDTELAKEKINNDVLKKIISKLSPELIIETLDTKLSKSEIDGTKINAILDGLENNKLEAIIKRLDISVIVIINYLNTKLSQSEIDGTKIKAILDGLENNKFEDIIKLSILEKTLYNIIKKDMDLNRLNSLQESERITELLERMIVKAAQNYEYNHFKTSKIDDGTEVRCNSKDNKVLVRPSYKCNLVERLLDENGIFVKKLSSSNKLKNLLTNLFLESVKFRNNFVMLLFLNLSANTDLMPNEVELLNNVGKYHNLFRTTLGESYDKVLEQAYTINEQKKKEVWKLNVASLDYQLAPKVDSNLKKWKNKQLLASKKKK